MFQDDVKILIVDDMPSNAFVLEALLKLEGKNTLTAHSGEKALELAASERPALILLDVVMPGMNGYEVCKRLKADEKTKSIPIIFISARDTVKARVKGLKLGAVDYISKPFDQSEIVARINVHLSLEISKLQLTEIEKNYEDLIENIHEGELLWDNSGIVYANHAFLDIVGISADDIYSKDVDDFVDAIYLDEFKKILTDTFLGKNSDVKKGYEISIIKEDGSKLICSCFFNIAMFSRKRCVRISVNNISQILELEKQLAQAQKMEAIGSLTSGIAHDFNNVLALINGYTELAMFESDKESPIYEKLKIILDAGKKAVSMTRGLLSFGRKKSMIVCPVNLNNEIRETYSFLSRSLPKNIKFNLEIPEESIAISADSGMIQQVLVNLCINGRDAMLKGGELTVALEAVSVETVPANASAEALPGRYSKISVVDTGTGISDEIETKIFDPFFTTKSSGKGSGLGLSMVARIINNHNGWIDVSSKIECGTTFSLYIPMIEEVVDVDVWKEAAATPVSGFEKIIVVDSDRVQAAMVQNILLQAGYNVDISCSKEEALVKLSSSEYDLILSDHKLPGLNGVELGIIVNEEYPKMKVIITADHGDVPTTSNLLLRKPFTASELITSFKRL